MTIALSPPGLLTVTAMPGGLLAGADPPVGRLNVLILPRLLAPGADQTIGGFTAAFGPLSTALFGMGGPAALTFEVAVARMPVMSGLSAVVPASPYDPTLWDVLLPPATAIGDAPSAAGLADPSITSYSVSGTYVGVANGLQPPPPDGDATEVRRLHATLTRLRDERPAITAHLRDLRARHRTLARRHFVAEPGAFGPELLALADATDYYTALAAGAQARAAAGGTTDVGPLDLHSAISAILRYPVMLRALGLLQEIDVPLNGLGATGQIRAVPGAVGSGWAGAAPWTLFSTGDTPATVFVAARADPVVIDDQIVNGVLELAADDVQPIGFDYDAVIHNLNGRLLQLAAATAADAPPPPLPLPAPRSNGLGLAKDELGLDMANILSAQASLETALGNDITGNGLVLGAEHVSRGLRIDIFSDKDPTWRSLAARQCTYTVIGWQGGIASASDEGVQPWRIFNPTADPTALWTHEALFQWSGWGLAVPRPGLATAQDGSTFDANAPDAGLNSNLPLQVVTTPVPGSLPRLRFGWTYTCRLRVADMAGYSPAVDDPVIAGSGVIELGTYYRWDPVIAPILVPQRAPGPGESVERLVIRCTDVTAPTTDIAERLVAPPRATVQMAEWHGMLDTASGVDAGAWTMITTLDGAFGTAPYGDTPPAIPYLPDPLGRGLCVNGGTPPTGGSQSTLQLALQTPFPGSWPQLTPLRLQLVEGAGPAFVVAGNIVTASLPKGEAAAFWLSSSVKRAPTDPDDTDIAILALCNGLTGKTLPFRNGVINGQQPQVTPLRALSFVHAVQRPVLVPTVSDPTGSVQSLGCDYQFTDGRTTAEFVPYVAIHAGSTGRLEINAEWDEMVDDGINPPAIRHVSKRACGTDVATDDPRFLSTEDPDGNPVPTPNFDLTTLITDFGDVRYPRITCTLVATTRFREYFPDAIASDPANLVQVSPAYTVDVQTPVPPPAPKVVGVMPLFVWSTTNTGSGTLRQRQTGIRVYLDRPWYASGDNEVLGVVLPISVPAPPPDPPGDPGPPGPPRPNPTVLPPDTISSPVAVSDVDAPLVTQWGLDPAYATDTLNTAFAPLPSAFTNAVFVMTDDGLLFIAEPRDTPCAVVAFAGQFQPPNPATPGLPGDLQRDPNNGRWYSDILLDVGPAGVPFLRLALVRVQPNSPDPTNNPYARPEVTRTVLADFVPLTAARIASVAPDAAGAQAVTVSVYGPGVAPNDAIDGTGRRLNEMIATVEADFSGGEGTTWAAFGETMLTAAFNSGDAVASWSGSLTLPAPRGGVAMRVVLREYEILPTDAAPSTPEVAAFTQGRLVYSDLIPL